MFQDLTDLLRSVSQGDEEALEKSGMTDSTAGKPEILKLSETYLRAEHYKACILQTSAEIFGMNMLGLLCKDYIDVLNVLAKEHYNFELEEITLEPQDYSDTMQEMLREISNKLVPLAQAFSKEREEKAAALPQNPDPLIDESGDNLDTTKTTHEDEADESCGTETTIQPGPSKSSSNYGRKRPRQSSPAPAHSEKTSKSRKKTKSKENTAKPKHYGKKKCPLCGVKVVHVRRHIIAMHSKVNERIPVSKVEALTQASKHGQETSGGQVMNKNKDGSVRVNRHKKMVCPLCESVTMYLTTHLQRVHKFAKGSEAYKDAIQNKRRYLGKRKEVKRVERALKNVKPKKRKTEKNSALNHQQPAPRKTPLQILVEEAELSDGSDVDFGDIVPPTPPPVIEEQNPLPFIEQPTAQLSDKDPDEDYQEEQEEEEEEDDDDEDYDEFITLKDYYARGVAKTDREKFYVMFCEHLKNIIGGCKKERQAILHTQHVRRIHDHMDPEKKDNTIESILEDGGVQVWKKWARPLLEEKKMRPGSVRTYLMSLAKFCEFLVDHVDHNVSGFPTVPDDIVRRARSVSARFKGMSSSIRKEYIHRKWEKQMEEEENALPVSVIQEMMDTQPAVEAIRNLTLSYHVPPNEKMFIAIRDFILARLEIENCQRPGALETATLTEFQRAKEVDGKMVMKVARHKTSKAGPAPITMSENTYSNVKAYVKHVRIHYAKQDEDALFVTREGDAFPSGTLGRRIIKWWKKATGRDVTSTQLRKVGSTETMDEDLETQLAVQALMTHRRSTAEEHYQILKKTKQAVKGHTALAKKLGLPESVATNFPEELEEDAKQCTEESTEVQSPRKKGLTEDQLADIDLLFAEKITTNAALTMTEVKNVMSESCNLMSDVHNYQMVRKVYNRVKYLQKKNFEQELEDVEDGQEVSTSTWVTTVSSPASGPTKRFCWSKQDEGTILDAFSTFDQCPAKKIIFERFQDVDELKDIATRNTIQRCYEKVKTIFKQRKK